MRQTPLLLLLLLLLSTTCDALRIIPSARARPPVMGYRPVKAPSAEEAAAKNPTAADRPEMSDRYKGLTANERDTKKNTRSRIMKKRSTSAAATHSIGPSTEASRRRCRSGSRASWSTR